jgi:hypothetical protein
MSSDRNSITMRVGGGEIALRVAGSRFCDRAR